MLSAEPMQKRLQLSGILLILGLLVEAMCLLWHGALAFLALLGLGGLLLFAGILVYLYSLVSLKHHS
jgi:hypothetical protein